MNRTAYPTSHRFWTASEAWRTRVAWGDGIAALARALYAAGPPGADPVAPRAR